ncbi:hypothetical protein AALA98_14655 [Lachnospiraceae bacterium 45-W7]
MEPPKRLITRILEAAFMLALAAYLIRSAAYWLLEVWPILLTIAIIVAAAVIGFRI